jgi:hypothetical protein
MGVSSKTQHEDTRLMIQAGRLTRILESLVQGRGSRSSLRGQYTAGLARSHLRPFQCNYRTLTRVFWLRTTSAARPRGPEARSSYLERIHGSANRGRSLFIPPCLTMLTPRPWLAEVLARIADQKLSRVAVLLP